MIVPATIEFPGKVVIVAECVPPLLHGVCVQGTIPGGTLYVDSKPRGTVVAIGPIDYDKIINAAGHCCDYVIYRTVLDVLLELV